MIATVTVDALLERFVGQLFEPDFRGFIFRTKHEFVLEDEAQSFARHVESIFSNTKNQYLTSDGAVWQQRKGVRFWVSPLAVVDREYGPKTDVSY